VRSGSGASRSAATAAAPARVMRSARSGDRAPAVAGIRMRDVLRDEAGNPLRDEVGNPLALVGVGSWRSPCGGLQAPCTVLAAAMVVRPAGDGSSAAVCAAAPAIAARRSSPGIGSASRASAALNLVNILKDQLGNSLLDETSHALLGAK